MKHAFLIIAHKSELLLSSIIEQLDFELFDIYVHIDKRSNVLFDKAKNIKTIHSRLTILNKRIATHWGDLSQVETEYLLFEEAKANGPYAYYHLLSGSDIILKSPEEICSFCKTNEGKEFISYWEDEASIRDLKRKTERYYLFTSLFKEGNPLIHSLTSVSRNIVLAVQKLFHTRRGKGEGIEMKKGSNWISISQEMCEYLITKKPWVMKRFKMTLCPDEIFVQTVAWNSAFKNKLYSSNEKNNLASRKIDWQRGSPYVWTPNDAEELRQSTCLFARKVDEQSFQLLKRNINKNKTNGIR